MKTLFERTVNSVAIDRTLDILFGNQAGANAFRVYELIDAAMQQGRDVGYHEGFKAAMDSETAANEAAVQAFVANVDAFELQRQSGDEQPEVSK